MFNEFMNLAISVLILVMTAIRDGLQLAYYGLLLNGLILLLFAVNLFFVIGNLLVGTYKTWHLTKIKYQKMLIYKKIKQSMNRNGKKKSRRIEQIRKYKALGSNDQMAVYEHVPKLDLSNVESDDRDRIIESRGSPRDRVSLSPFRNKKSKRK